MAQTLTLTDPELIALVRELADDARVWANRLAHDNGGRQDSASARIGRDATARAADAGRIVRACDAALAVTREAA